MQDTNRNVGWAGGRCEDDAASDNASAETGSAVSGAEVQELLYQAEAAHAGETENVQQVMKFGFCQRGVTASTCSNGLIPLKNMARHLAILWLLLQSCISVLSDCRWAALASPGAAAAGGGPARLLLQGAAGGRRRRCIRHRRHLLPGPAAGMPLQCKACNTACEYTYRAAAAFATGVACSLDLQQVGTGLHEMKTGVSRSSTVSNMYCTI